MVSQLPGPSHPPGEASGRGPRRILLRIASVAAISTAILFGVVLWVLPLLGHHGDLNAVVEGIIRVREASAESPEAIRLEEREGSLEVSAALLGELDRVQFHVERRAEGEVDFAPCPSGLRLLG